MSYSLNSLKGALSGIVMGVEGLGLVPIWYNEVGFNFLRGLYRGLL